MLLWGMSGSVRAGRAGSPEHLGALLRKVPGHVLVHVVEHRLERWSGCSLGDRYGIAKALIDLRTERQLLLVGPEAVLIEPGPESPDRIARGPSFQRLALSITIRIVARGVAAHTVRDGLDQCRSLAPHAALDRALGRGDHRENVVAVHAH